MKAIMMIFAVATLFLTACGGAQTEQPVTDSTVVVDTLAVQDSVVSADTVAASNQ